MKINISNNFIKLLQYSFVYLKKKLGQFYSAQAKQILHHI